MKKLFIKYFVTLFMFLLSAHGQLHAHARNEIATYSTANSLPGSENQTHSVPQKHHAVVNKSFSSFAASDKIDVTDSDDEDDKNTDSTKIISLKKHLETANYFATLFGTQTPEYFTQCIKKRLFAFNHSYYFPASKRFIVLRVIRI